MLRTLLSDLLSPRRPRRRSNAVAAIIERLESRCLLVAKVTTILSVGENYNIPGQASGLFLATTSQDGGVADSYCKIEILNPPEHYSIELNGVKYDDYIYHRPQRYEADDIESVFHSLYTSVGDSKGLVWGQNTAVVRNSADGSTSNPVSFYLGPPDLGLGEAVRLNPTVPVIGQDVEVTLTAQQLNNRVTVKLLKIFADDEIADDGSEGTAVSFTNLQITGRQLSFIIPASEPLSPGTYAIVVDSLTSGVGLIGLGSRARFSERRFEIPFLKPVITGFDPAEVEVGTGNVTFTIQGAGFAGRQGLQNGTEVFLVDPDTEVAGRLRTVQPRFQVIDSSTIQVTVAASLLANTQRLDVFVLNPAKTLEEGSSNVERLVLKLPTPKIVSLSDLVATAGSGAKTLQIVGEDFADAVVHWGSTVLTPTTEIDDLLEVSVPASLLAAAGTTPITVENQHPTSNQTSTAASFKVINPSAVSLNPISIVLEGSVTGFVVSSPQRSFVPPFGAGQSNVVKLNGTPLTTTYNGGGQLVATFPGDQPPAAGTYEVSVVDHLGETLGPTTLTVKNPKPVFNGGSFISHGIAAPGQDFTLRIDGTGYVPGVTVTFDGDKFPATILDGTRLEVVIPGDRIPIPTSTPNGLGLQADFTVSNPLPNAGATPGFFRVKNPIPTITSVEPQDVEPAEFEFTQAFDTQGGGFLPVIEPVEGRHTFLVRGTGFVSGLSKVGFFPSDTTFETTVLSATELRVSVPRSFLRPDGEVSFYVFNPGDGGGSSELGSFRVTNPAPQIHTLSKSFVRLSHGGESPDYQTEEITIIGQNFTPDAMVKIDGPADEYHIRIMSITKNEIRFRLVKLIPSLTDAGTATIRVANRDRYSPSGRIESNSLSLVVLRPRPEISYLSSFTDTDGVRKLLVTGNGVDEDTIVEWNGETLQTSPRELFNPYGSFKAIHSGGLNAAPGTVNVRFLNSDGQFSLPKSWSTPTITSVSQTKFEVGLGPVTFTVLGENFANGSVVEFGQIGNTHFSFESTFVSSTELRAVMPLEFLTINQIPANASSNRFWGPIKVTNPDGNEGVGQYLTITRPTAAVTTVSPTSVVAGSAGFTLTIEGRNFSPGNTFVLFGGRELVTTATSSTRLTAVVPANFIVTSAEALELTVGRTDNAGILNGNANFTILPAPDSRRLSITATATGKPEGNDPNVTPFALLHTFTITRTGATTAAASVSYSVVGSGANPASADDFLLNAFPSGTINFAPNQASQVITIAAHGDTTIEPNETFDVVLSNVTGGSILTAIATGTIISDDTSFGIAAANANKAEGNTATTAFTFTVTREGATTAVGSVKYAVTGSGSNPAIAADFGSSLPTGTVSFAIGETSKTITVNVKGEVVFEPDEGFTVTLNTPTGGTLGEITTATGTILNDDSGFSIAATDANKSEGNSGTTPFTFTVTRGGGTITPATVKFTVTAPSGGANAADFGATALPSGTLNFAPGDKSKTITLNVVGDTAIENNENFVVTLSAPVGASLGTAVANGTIQTDDTALAIAVAPSGSNKVEGHSGSTAHTFTVTRTGLTTGVTNVNFHVAGVGPNPADEDDFGGEFVDDVLEFAAGEIAKVISINVMGDAAIEPTETFSVTLSSPVGASSLLTPTATGTIISDDSSFSITPLSTSKAEGNSGNVPFTFTVSRNGSTLGAASVNFVVTGSGANAADVTDFGTAFPSGIVSFKTGESSKVVTINVKGDAAFEPDEGFAVTLMNPLGGVLEHASTNGTILSDDATLTIAATNANQLEGSSNGSTPFTFTVTRIGGINVPASVKFTTATNGTGVTAAAATDFVGGKFPAGTLNIPAGQATATLTINGLGDTAVEGNEGFKVTLSAPTGALLGAAANITANGVIQNDDASVAITATSAVKAEGTSDTPTQYTFTVTRTGDTTVESSVAFAVTGAATNGANAADFGGTFPTGTVEFAPNESSKVITIDVTSDNVGEANEGFLVTLSNPTNASVGVTAANGTINNDDTSFAILPVNATSAVKGEGSSTSNPLANTAFTFTATRIGLPVAGSVQFAVSGSGDNPADASDFANGLLPAGTLTFTAAQTSLTVTINVRADKVVEFNEGFTLTLSNPPVGANLITPVANGTINNDDTSFAIAAVDAVNNETNTDTTPFTFRITREGVINGTATVNLAITGAMGANAANGSDFGTTFNTNFGTALPHAKVLFAANQSTALITINVKGDTTAEPDESFIVTLSSPSTGATILTASALGIILNDD